MSFDDSVLAEYLTDRRTVRSAAVADMVQRLTDRELLLVKEAAVMGWVQGKRNHDLPHILDADVLFHVLDACRSFPDLYPTITGHRGEENES